MQSALFLFNLSTRLLHGVFDAAGAGAENIDPTAWSRNKHKAWSSPFPAQIEFRVARAFTPLPDSDLRTVFRDSDRIRKLDGKEVSKIIRLFRTRELNKGKPATVFLRIHLSSDCCSSCLSGFPGAIAWVVMYFVMAFIR